MCIALSLWLNFLQKQKWHMIGWIAFLSIITQFVNPIAFATVDAGFAGAALFSWWRKRKVNLQDIGALPAIAITQIPLLAYNYIILRQDPIWKSIYIPKSNTLPAFRLLHLWLCTLLDTCHSRNNVRHQRKIRRGGRPIFWLAFAFLFAYAPVEIQRRFLQNITIPLTLLVVPVLKILFETISTQSLVVKRWGKGLVLFVVFFVVVVIHSA